MERSKSRTGSDNQPDDQAHASDASTYPLFKYATTDRQILQRGHQTNVIHHQSISPTFNLRLMKARVYRQLNPLFTSTSKPKSRVLFACTEPTLTAIESNKYNRTYDVSKLKVSPNDLTLVRLGDTYEISVVGFCLPSHLLQFPARSHRLLYSVVNNEKCKIHYDGTAQGQDRDRERDREGDSYIGVPASKCLYTSRKNAPPDEFSMQFKLMEFGSVANHHAHKIQRLNLFSQSVPTTDNNKFLSHVSAVVDAANDLHPSTSTPSPSLPSASIEDCAIPRIAASISASFYVTSERESHPLEEQYGGETPSSWDADSPIPLRYGYFIIFEKAVKNRVYLNTETSDMINPLTIFNIPLEHVCYIIVRVSPGITDHSAKLVPHDTMRVENLLQLGEAVRTVRNA